MPTDYTMKNGKLYSNELRKLAKAANQRMVELEKRGFNSPAYQSVQARLEALGRRAKTAQGRRFSESGTFKNRNEAAQIEATLRRFMQQETSKLSGYRKYRKDVLEGLERHYHYREQGLSDEDMMAFWEAMPDNERDRIYGSDETFLIVAKFLKDKKARKRKEDAMTDAEKLKREEEMTPEERKEFERMQRIDEYTMSEIIDLINQQKSLSAALDALGISTREYMDYKAGNRPNLGAL